MDLSTRITEYWNNRTVSLDEALFSINFPIEYLSLCDKGYFHVLSEEINKWSRNNMDSKTKYVYL